MKTLTLLAPLFLSQDQVVEGPIAILGMEHVHHSDQYFVREGQLWVPSAALPDLIGFKLKEQALYSGNTCINLSSKQDWCAEQAGETFFNLSGFARNTQQAFARSEDSRTWSFAAHPELPSPLQSGRAPDFELLDRDGNEVRLSDFRGVKVLLLTWATW